MSQNDRKPDDRDILLRQAVGEIRELRRVNNILSGQVFVFFILTVAAAESAIGLAILVVLFRERRSINVENLDRMRG